MVNFKEETLEVLHKHNKTWEDIKFIQGDDFRISNDTDEILKLMDFCYDDGYGWAEIATDLIIAGDNWWLERCDYDGSEWWVFKEFPKPKEKTQKIERFMIKREQTGWSSLEEINCKE